MSGVKKLVALFVECFQFSNCS